MLKLLDFFFLNGSSSCLSTSLVLQKERVDPAISKRSLLFTSRVAVSNCGTISSQAAVMALAVTCLVLNPYCLSSADHGTCTSVRAHWEWWLSTEEAAHLTLCTITKLLSILPPWPQPFFHSLFKPATQFDFNCYKSVIETTWPKT